VLLLLLRPVLRPVSSSTAAATATAFGSYSHNGYYLSQRSRSRRRRRTAAARRDFDFDTSSSCNSSCRFSRGFAVDDDDVGRGTRTTTALSMSSSSSSDGSNFNDNNYNKLTASERARREEELGRKARKDDVVIGKTSAKLGQRDYELDVSATEQEYLRQASDVDRAVFQLTERGMAALKMLKVHEAQRCFDEVFRIKPDAYLWQSGIALFYSDRLKEAAQALSRNALLYERKFGGDGTQPATEERIWHDACRLKRYWCGMSRRERQRKRQRQQRIENGNEKDNEKDDDGGGGDGSIADAVDIDPIPDLESQRDEQGTGDVSGASGGGEGGEVWTSSQQPSPPMIESRKVFRIVRELFAASLREDDAAVILARARLRSIGGGGGSRTTTSTRKRKGTVVDRKMWKLTSWFYLGLHYDAIGEYEQSKRCMKTALQLCPSSGNGSDIVHTLPLLHMSQRDWFDDDAFDDDDDDFSGSDNSDDDSDNGGDRRDEYDNCRADAHTPKSTGTNSGIDASSSFVSDPATAATDTADPVLAESILSSVSELRRVDLQKALRLRGLKHSGSKPVLQQRLFQSLMEDASLIGDSFQ